MTQATQADRDARLQALVDANDDHIVATGESFEWLVEQSLAWPRRIHPDRTTNDRFLRYSMAATLLAARQQGRREGLEEAAKVVEGFGILDAGSVAAAIRNLMKGGEDGEVRR